MEPPRVPLIRSSQTWHNFSFILLESSWWISPTKFIHREGIRATVFYSAQIFTSNLILTMDRENFSIFG